MLEVLPQIHLTPATEEAGTFLLSFECWEMLLNLTLGR